MTTTYSVTATDNNGCAKIDSMKITVTGGTIVVEKIAMLTNLLSLQVGDSAVLSVIISPDDASDKAVIWNSSNSSIVTVGSTGVVKATGVGSAVITCSSSSNPEATASCTVTVTTIIIVDKTYLLLTIDSAQWQYTNAVEGTTQGNHPVGSKAQLLEAITAAKTVYDNVKASQAEVDTATSDIHVALESFIKNIITCDGFTISASASTTSVCVGESLILSGSGDASFVWDNNVVDGVACKPAASATFSVTGTNAAGCTFTASVDITVHPLPTVSLRDTAISIVDSLYVTPNSNYSSYVWTNGTTSPVCGIKGSDLPVGENQFGVTITDENGCSNSASATIAVKDTAKGIYLVEYFFDAEPGFGNGKHVFISASANIYDTIQAALSSLSPGFHTLYLRVKDTKGRWSMTTSRPIMRTRPSADTATLVKAEYFVDTDPGLGNAKSLALASMPQSFTFAADTLKPGFHTIYIRYKDNFGAWGHTVYRSFMKSKAVVDSLVKAEYFVDTDPGFGNATSIKLSTASELDTITISTELLSFGCHTMYLRTRDNSGAWSQTVSRPFVRTKADAKIVAVEYFVGDEVAAGSGRKAVIDQPFENDTVDVAIDMLCEQAGSYTTGFRARDSYGTWSPVSSTSVTRKDIALKALSDTVIYEGDTVLLSTAELASCSYSWALNGEAIAGSARSLSVTKAGKYSVTIKNAGNCSATTNTVSVSFRKPVILNKNVSICGGNSYFAGGANQTQSGVYYDTVFYRTFVDSVLVTNLVVNMPPTEAFAGSDSSGIKTTSIALNATAPPVGTGFWKIESGDGGSISDTLDANASFTGKKGSSYVLSWNVYNDCGTAEDEVSLTFANDTTPKYVETIALQSSLGLLVNATATLIPLVYPSDAVNARLLWYTSNANIAAVDSLGLITAKAVGTATIMVQTKDGSKMAACKVMVSASQVAVKSVTLADTVKVTVGDRAILSPTVNPANATVLSTLWSSSNDSIATVKDGIVTGLRTGVTKAQVKVNGVSATCFVTVLNSEAPVVSTLPEVTLKTGDSKTIDLSKYISDDNTSFKDLTIKVSSNAGITTTVADGILTVTSTKIGIDTVHVTITDNSGWTVETYTIVSVSSNTNTAPVISVPGLTIVGDGSVSLSVDDYITDDYTDSVYVTVTGGDNVSATVSNGEIVVVPVVAGWSGTDTITITAVDGAGLTSSKQVIVSVASTVAVNKAPVISEIPSQVNSSTSSFTPINLMSYVTDDYTLPHSIDWRISISSKLSVSITSNVAVPQIIDEAWLGIENVWFYATDGGGLTDSVLVSFTQSKTTSIPAVGLPEIDFSADRTVISPGKSVSFAASLSGASTWLWQFEGATIDESDNLNPSVTYRKPGNYKVTLIAANANGTDTLTKSEWIHVFGIVTANNTICNGNSATLSTNTVTGIANLKWNTSQTTAAIEVAPVATTTYFVTATYGLFKLSDTITITVQQPVKLPADTALCEGSALTLNAGNFASYKWNKNAVQTGQTLVVSTKGTYFVDVVDEVGCASADTLKITDIWTKPVSKLGTDTSICSGREVTLDAGVAASWKWNNGSTSRTITTSSSDDYTVTLTNDHSCASAHTIHVSLLEPFEEQIGVVTYSETTNNKVIIAWNRTKGKRTQKYEVYRESDVANDFSVFVGSTAFNDPSVVYDNANLSEQAYRYQLVTTDSACHNNAYSTPHMTIHLQTSYSQESGVNLSWNTYQGLELSTYHVVRITADGKSEVIKSLANNTSPITYTDPNPVANSRYRITFDIDSVYPSLLKSDSGPYSQSLSNLAESELLGSKIVTSSGDIRVYPNPVSDIFTVTTETTGSYTLSITNELGEVIQRRNIDEQSAKINMSNFATGIYFVMIQTENEVNTIRIFKY